MKLEVWLEPTGALMPEGPDISKGAQVKPTWKFDASQAGISALKSGFF